MAKTLLVLCVYDIKCNDGVSDMSIFKRLQLTLKNRKRVLYVFMCLRRFLNYSK